LCDSLLGTTGAQIYNGRMRIIGGTAAGTLLKAPKGFAVRPTPDLVKQAIFNSLGDRVVGARVLELFGGTGALGLECLSRGAAHLVCVEHNRQHADFIRQNMLSAHLSPPTMELRMQEVVTAVHQLGESGRQFDLILADPPFGDKNVGRRSTSCSQQLLDDTILPALLTIEGLFVLGHARRDSLTVSSHWRELKTLKHGDSLMICLQRRLPNAS
jgi:16S rRNA (guanine966-N2)-methyltransferase